MVSLDFIHLLPELSGNRSGARYAPKIKGKIGGPAWLCPSTNQKVLLSFLRIAPSGLPKDRLYAGETSDFLHRSQKFPRKSKLGLVTRGPRPRFAAPQPDPPTFVEACHSTKEKFIGSAPEKSFSKGSLVVAPVCPHAKPEPRRKSCRPSISSFARDASLRPKSRSHPLS